MTEKWGASMPVSRELLWLSQDDERYRRKARWEPAPAAEWDAYRRAKKLLKQLQASPYYDDGGPDYSARVREPDPVATHLETEDEWRARCVALDGGRAGRGRGDGRE